MLRAANMRPLGNNSVKNGRERKRERKRERERERGKRETEERRWRKRFGSDIFFLVSS